VWISSGRSPCLKQRSWAEGRFTGKTNKKQKEKKNAAKTLWVGQFVMSLVTAMNLEEHSLMEIITGNM